MKEKIITKIKNNKYILYISIPLLLVILLITSKVIVGKELYIDKLAYHLFIEKLRNDKLTTFMKLATKLSNPEVMIVIAIISIFFCIKLIKNKKLSLGIILNLAGITLINQILKFIFKRERPTGYRLIEMSGYSFPSGHAMASLAFYGLLIYITKRLVKNKYLKILLITLNIAIIILIGVSRIYLGVHYLSDVLTGYSISIIYLLITTKLLNKYKVFP